MNDERCAHANLAETTITHTAVGRKWMQSGPCSYCPDCRRWTTRTTRFYDGDFFPNNRAAALANEDYRLLCEAERHAWVAEHYPEHVVPRGGAA